MSVMFRADDEGVGSRAEYWHHVVSQAVGPLDVRAPGGLGARDRLLAGDAGPVGVVELSIGDASAAERGPAHIRRSEPGLCKIDVLAHGRGVIEHNDREARQAPGDFTLVDLARPCRWSYASARVVAAVFPRELLPLPPRDLGRLAGTRVRGDDGAAALVSSLARRLPGHLDDHGAAGRARLGTALLDVLSVALAARVDRAQAVPAESRRRALLLAIHAFIERRLGDPALSPRSIAGAHYISIRYLHKLFETEETTVAEWIRHRRLERCRRDLADPALRTHPVHAIGARWGLADAAHFSRLFRAAYGVPPAQYRRAALTR